MPILPIDTGRYGTSEMKSIFEEENRIQKMLDVEAALALAHAEVGNIPVKDAENIANVATIKHVKLSRIKEIEQEIKHDTASLVKALAEAAGSSGGYVHLGATSYDIVDTAVALQLKDAIAIIEDRLNTLEKTLMGKTAQYVDTLMIGRTHGQHALPITLGFKFAVWMREISRHIQRLQQIKPRILVGKMSGAVGVQAGLGSKALEIQKIVMHKLGLEPADISTQILQRDRHAEFICFLAIAATTLDKFANEIRELQRPEIGEIFEHFGSEIRVGSSTMPHKQDPETCETICGLAKIVRSLTFPALQNVITWHERDMTQSSAERFLIPESCIIVDHMLYKMTNVIVNLKIDEKRMMTNTEITQGRTMSEAVMIALTKKSMSRQEAHELLKKLAIKSKLEGCHFKEILLENKTITSKLNEKEIDEALNPRNYLGTAQKQIELTVKKTRHERKTRGL